MSKCRSVAGRCARERNPIAHLQWKLIMQLHNYDRKESFGRGKVPLRCRPKNAKRFSRVWSSAAGSTVRKWQTVTPARIIPIIKQTRNQCGCTLRANSRVPLRICEMARANSILVGFRFDSSCKFIRIFLLQKADFFYTNSLLELVFGAAYFIDPTFAIGNH